MTIVPNFSLPTENCTTFCIGVRGSRHRRGAGRTLPSCCAVTGSRLLWLQLGPCSLPHRLLFLTATLPSSLPPPLPTWAGRVWALPAQPRVLGAAVAGPHAVEAQARRHPPPRLDGCGAPGRGAGPGAPGRLCLPAPALPLHRGGPLPVHLGHRRQPAPGGVWRRPSAGARLAVGVAGSVGMLSL